MLNLPDAFIEEMRQLFAEVGRSIELPLFLAAMQAEPRQGLRANRLKIGRSELQALLGTATGLETAEMIPVPWSDDGLIFPEKLMPGKLPAHLAGLYYIQEPSAMLPAVVLAAQPGDRVLDLCAAPGGKSARIAADLQESGLLWANEISAERVRALLRNVELTGSRQTVLTQEPPERLARQLPEVFDRILVDAPCSGSGMFRRDPAAIRSWLAYGSASCTPLQRDILASAWSMLRPGGRLVYSTCTFSVTENEEMVSWFLDQHPDARLLPIEKTDGVDDGLPIRNGMTATARIWPHRSPGEGHFCALLEKVSILDAESAQSNLNWVPEVGPEAAWSVFREFCLRTLTPSGVNRLDRDLMAGSRRYENGHLHLLPACPNGLSVLKKVKTGLFLGQVKPIRQTGFTFEPSHALLLSLRADELRYTVASEGHSDLVRRYLRGETLSLDGEDRTGQLRPLVHPDDGNHWPDGRLGAVMLSDGCHAWPLGWARMTTNPLLKNLYPPGWRRSS